MQHGVLAPYQEVTGLRTRLGQPRHQLNVAIGAEP